MLNIEINRALGIGQSEIFRIQDSAMALSVANTAALSNWADLVSCEPISSMVRVETMIAVYAKHDKTAHNLRLRRFSIGLVIGLSSDTSSRHRIWRAQPESADTASRHVSATFRADCSRHCGRPKRIADSRMNGFSGGGRRDLGGSVVLSKRTCTIVAGQANLLRRRRYELLTVNSYCKAPRANVKSSSLELEFPGIHLSPIGLAPGFKLGDVGWMTDDSWNCIAHS